MTDLHIDSIAAGGDGVGRSEGMVIFVPRAAVRDFLDVRVVGKKRFGRGMIRSIVRPSPDRVEPPCAHYTRDRCGGCQLQHIAYTAQLTAKASIIRDGLARIGKREVDAPVVERSPAEWRYRSKLTLAFQRRDAQWTIGLHRFDDPAAVFQLEDCPITDDRVIAVWRAIFRQTHLLPPGTTRGAVRLLDDGTASVVLEGEGAFADPGGVLHAIPSVSAVWWKSPASASRLMAARTHDRTGASFAQVNPAVATRLHQFVVERASSYRPARAVDAYAGSGGTAIPLAASGVQVTAIELDRHATESMGARLPAGSRAIAGAVEDHLPSLLPTDLVLLNPPRTGLAESVPAHLEARPPAAVIYVSCNPATLGRDLARLPGYRIAAIRGFDMFPQTAHVETVCELIRAA